tara:strand:+ start:951 stop:1070 length:120 start_codon:yes stop_codon:yes gene_type:complete
MALKIRVSMTPPILLAPEKAESMSQKVGESIKSRFISFI